MHSVPGREVAAPVKTVLVGDLDEFADAASPAERLNRAAEGIVARVDVEGGSKAMIAERLDVYALANAVRTVARRLFALVPGG